MIVSNCFLFFRSLFRPALPPWGPPVALFPSPHFHPGEGEGRILRQFWQVKIPGSWDHPRWSQWPLGSV